MASTMIDCFEDDKCFIISNKYAYYSYDKYGIFTTEDFEIIPKNFSYTDLVIMLKGVNYRNSLTDYEKELFNKIIDLQGKLYKYEDWE